MVKLEGVEEESQRIHRDIRDIRVSGVMKLLHNEIAIHDFSTRSEPFGVRDAYPRI
jgi:hypothetical protein